MPKHAQTAELHARTADTGQRELEAVHEIAQAFLAASQPVEVFRLALARLTPMVRASFAAVFVRDEADAETLRLACAQGWPQSSALYLGELRIRVGRGPTGRAVAENSAIEVHDVFADRALEEWWEPARELGFASLIALPLATPHGVTGAVTFYFAQPRHFTDAERNLLRRISEHLAATTLRARVVEEARLEAEQMRRDKEVLERALKHRNEQSRLHDRLSLSVCHDVRNALDSAQKALRAAESTNRNGSEVLLDGARRTLSDFTGLLELRLNQTRLHTSPEDAVRLARLALEAAGDAPTGVTLRVEATESIVPITTDGPRVSRILATMIAQAFRRTTRGEIVFEISQAHDGKGGSVYWTLSARGLGVNGGGPTGNGSHIDHEDLDAALARELTRALGGEIWFDSSPAAGSVYRLRLPARRPR
jgi:signal transduction histidine kinase